MIVFDTVMIWILRVIAGAAFAGAGCMVALILIYDHKIAEAEKQIKKRNEALREVEMPNWEDIL